MTALIEKFRVIPMILVMGIIFFLSHLPGNALSLPLIPGLDKIAHFLIYGILAGTVILAHGEHRRRNAPARVALQSVSVCLIYGLSDEAHQYFVPGRFASMMDLCADLLGAIAVSWGWWKLRGWSRSRTGLEGQSEDAGVKS